MNMSAQSNPDEPGYWAVDAPGLTEEQADWLVSVINDSPHDLPAYPIDPAHWLAIYIDREGAEVVARALRSLPGDDRIAAGLREIFEDWLHAVARCDNEGEDSEP